MLGGARIAHALWVSRPSEDGKRRAGRPAGRPLGRSLGLPFADESNHAANVTAVDVKQQCVLTVGCRSGAGGPEPRRLAAAYTDRRLRSPLREPCLLVPARVVKAVDRRQLVPPM